MYFSFKVNTAFRYKSFKAYPSLKSCEVTYFRFYEQEFVSNLLKNQARRGLYVFFFLQVVSFILKEGLM